MIKLSKCDVNKQEHDAIGEVLTSAYLGMGKQTFEFETELKTYLGTDKEVVCVSSGTAALHLALACLDIGPGDEVLVPTITFVASFQAISATGAKPIACDVHADTLAIDLASAKSHLTEKTRAIMPVHYASHVNDAKALYDFAARHQLRVVEDAAHAFGTLYAGKLVGAQGDIVCFSFDGIKNITCGEGGAIVTDDEKLLSRLRDARLLAVEKDHLQRKMGKRSWEFDIQHQGYRYHMSDIMAAIGRTQLQKIDYFKKRRQQLVFRYLQELSSLPDLEFLKLDYANILPHIFVLRILNNKRDGLKTYLQEHNVETGVHYKPNHLLTRYKATYSLPCAEQVYQEILTLPLHVGLQEEEQATVINLIKMHLKNA